MITVVQKVVPRRRLDRQAGVAPIAPKVAALPAWAPPAPAQRHLAVADGQVATVTLYDGATPVGSVLAGASGWSITTNALADGTHRLTARSTDLAGNATSGTATTITVAPTAPAAPLLAPASDSGSSNCDRITNVTLPTVVGSTESGATKTLLSSTTAVGTAAATGTGYTVTATTALTSGSRTMTVRATDVAGNTSASSASTVVTIDVTAPTKPGTPSLSAASDTGRSATDRITRVTTPTFTGTTTAGTTVNLFAGSTQVATTYASGTAWSLTTSTLASAAYTVTARSVDVAGNVSIPSNGCPSPSTPSRRWLRRSRRPMR